MKPHKSVIIGGGPAGLIAAETLAKAGFAVTVYERKASLGRKFLMAGRGGLNLTHSEALDKFLGRYNEASPFISPLIEAFRPEDLRQWCEELGEPTFIGSSGRVFPKSFKASPLLRAWIKRLETLGVEFRMQRQWTGWDANNHLVFLDQDNAAETVAVDTTLLALGGASWPNLGSDGLWTSLFESKNIPVSALRPANCGFHVEWTDIFRGKFSGQPLKSISITFENRTVAGEIMISAKGIEGGAIYALSSLLRQSLEQHKETILKIDLRPTLTTDTITKKLNQPRGKLSFSNYLQRTLGLDALSINLLRESDRLVADYTPERLASLIKSVPVRLESPFPVDRAISSAGGIKLEALDKNLMLKELPGVFACGEMLDWEAPTGGYLLQASFATGLAAAKGIINYATKS